MTRKNPVRGLDPMSEYDPEDTPSGLSMGEKAGVAGAAGAAAATAGIKKYLEARNAREKRERQESDEGAIANQKKYGMKKGGKVSSASKRADGCAQRGKTKGRMI